MRTLETFQGTHTLGASRGLLCDSSAILLHTLTATCARRQLSTNPQVVDMPRTYIYALLLPRYAQCSCLCPTRCPHNPHSKNPGAARAKLQATFPSNQTAAVSSSLGPLTFQQCPFCPSPLLPQKSRKHAKSRSKVSLSKIPHHTQFSGLQHQIWTQFEIENSATVNIMYYYLQLFAFIKHKERCFFSILLQIYPCSSILEYRRKGFETNQKQTQN